jgi:hypothetical protein
MTSPAISNANFIAAFGQPASFSIPPMPGYQTLAVNPASALASVASLQGCATTSLESCFASMSNGQYASLVHNAQASSNAIAGLFNNTVAQAQKGYQHIEGQSFNFYTDLFSSAVNKNDLKHQDQTLLKEQNNSALSSNPMMHGIVSGVKTIGHGAVVGGKSIAHYVWTVPTRAISSAINNFLNQF